MDQVIERVYLCAQGAQTVYLVFQEFALARFPYGLQIILASTIINATMGVHSANKDKPTLYWLHSLVQVVLAGFGGGIITPVILGTKPSIIFMNEAVIPMCVIFWYLVNYCGFDRLFNWKPVKLLWNIVVSVWRCNGTVNTINAACVHFPKSIYYPTPLMGPLIGGTLINSLGAFVPFDKGLSPIQKGTPWPIQSAFVSAVLYFFIVKDRDGPVGIAVRSVVGDLSATAVSTFIVGMQVLTLSSQVIFDDPNANFLTPVHRYSYYFLGLQGPPTPPATVAAASDVSKAKDIDVQKKPAVSPFRKFVLSVRAVAAVLFGVYLLSWRIPPVSLPAIAEVEVFQKDGAPHVTLHTVSGGLTAARSVGVCQWPQLLPFPAATQCPPHLLRLEEHYPCVNDTCGASVEDALRHNVSDNLKFRLAVHPAVAGVTAGVATVEWATTLPVDLDEGKQYQPESASLYLSRSSELYLVSHAQFSGTIFTPARITARLLWRGQPAITCVNKTAPGEGRANVTVKPAEAEALFLDPTSGAPRIRCSDGSSVELVIGEVYKPTPKQQMHLDTPVSPPVPVSSSSIKAEL